MPLDLAMMKAKVSDSGYDTRCWRDELKPVLAGSGFDRLTGVDVSLAYNITSIPTGPQYHGRVVTTLRSSSSVHPHSRQYHEIYSYNSDQHPPYPGRRLPAKFNFPFTTPLFTDGSMGKSDPTLVPQHYIEDFPSLPLIRRQRYGQLDTSKRPEYKDLHTVWQSDDSNGYSFCHGYTQPEYVAALVRRRADLSQAYGNLQPFHTDWPNFLSSWSDLLPSDNDITALALLQDFSSFVPKIAAIQRRFKLAESWITMADIIKNHVVPTPVEPFPQVCRSDRQDERFMGLWGNGLKSSKMLSWFLYVAKVPVFWVAHAALQDGKLTPGSLVCHHPLERTDLERYRKTWSESKVLSQLNEENYYVTEFIDEFIDEHHLHRENTIAYKPKFTPVAPSAVPPAVLNVKEGHKWEKFVETTDPSADRVVFVKVGRNRQPDDEQEFTRYWDRENYRVLYFTDALKLPPIHGGAKIFGFPCPEYDFFMTRTFVNEAKLHRSKWLYLQKYPIPGTIGQSPPITLDQEPPLTMIVPKVSCGSVSTGTRTGVVLLSTYLPTLMMGAIKPVVHDVDVESCQPLAVPVSENLISAIAELNITGASEVGAPKVAASSDFLRQAEIETLLAPSGSAIAVDQSDGDMLQDHNRLPGTNLVHDDVIISISCNTQPEESELVDADGVSLGSESDAAEEREDIHSVEQDEAERGQQRSNELLSVPSPVLYRSILTENGAEQDHLISSSLPNPYTDPPTSLMARTKRKREGDESRLFCFPKKMRQFSNESFFLQVQSGEQYQNIADFREVLFATFPGAAEGLRVIRSILKGSGERDFLMKFHFLNQAKAAFEDLRSKFQVDYISDKDWHTLRYEAESTKARYELDWSSEEVYREVKVKLKSRRYRSGRKKTLKQKQLGRDVLP